MALMLSAEHLFISFCAITFPVVFVFTMVLISISSFFHYIGIQKKYVQMLLKLFKWCANEAHNKSLRRPLHEDNLVDGMRNAEKATGMIIRRESDASMLGTAEFNVTGNAWDFVSDSLNFAKVGFEVIIQDDVTGRFETEKLQTWNLLRRTSPFFYRDTNWKIELIWVAGFIFRYLFLLPIRFTLMMSGGIFLVVSSALIGLLSESSLKSRLNGICSRCSFLVLSESITAVITFHNQDNKSTKNGMYVANHTSPLDVAILGTDCVYAQVGQRHVGILGIFQRALSRAGSHIWFERSEAKDRSYVAASLKKHINEPNKPPILIFPEGTCINNTSVMMFKKGPFEAASTVYPVAIKYDPLFGDAFWNSSEQNWLEYTLYTLTSWAIMCDVWYLEPMDKLPNEDAVSFANRVKRAIAERIGLIDLQWDGELKRSKVPSKMISDNQTKYSGRLKRYDWFPNDDAQLRNRLSNGK